MINGILIHNLANKNCNCNFSRFNLLYCSTFDLKFLFFSYIIVTLIERINEKLKELESKQVKSGISDDSCNFCF